MTTSLDDTITALSTPHAGAQAAIVRISGPEAVEVFRKAFKSNIPLVHYKAVKTEIMPSGFPVPFNAEILFMKAPASYTTEDVVEIHFPGAMPVAQSVIESILNAGARLAGPGEFTKRAFLGGRLDLAQAEAVGRIISASDSRELKIASLNLRGHASRTLSEIRDDIVVTLSRLEMSIDFAEQDIEFVTKEEILNRLEDLASRLSQIVPDIGSGPAQGGARVLLAGRTNAGKSSLFNILAGKSIAITHHVPGTTRDYLTAAGEIEDAPVTLVDTAGTGIEENEIDRVAVAESSRQVKLADLVIYVIEPGSPSVEEDIFDFNKLNGLKIPVINKVDLAEPGENYPPGSILISCKTGRGIENLKNRISEILKKDVEFSTSSMLLGQRHRGALKTALDSVKSAMEGARSGVSEEFIAVEIREALDAMGEITGETTPDDVLDAIFSDFCIGK